MNIFEQFGIKEVADVTLYSIHKKQDGSGSLYYVPALYLDTLKISSTEKTADNVWAEGGYGNSRLISWDYGKKININLTDALCTPASLGLCWGGILGADWKDAHIDIKSPACGNCNPVERLDRIEKSFFPGGDKERSYISNLLPQISGDDMDEELGLLRISSVVDGTKIQGFGNIGKHSYRWHMAIESSVCSIAQVPDRFFDINGQPYNIDINRKVSAHSLPTYRNYKDAVIYKINSKTLTPPMAKIIFDGDIEGKYQRTSIQLIANDKDVATMTLAQLVKAAGYQITTDGLLHITSGDYEGFYYTTNRWNKIYSGTIDANNKYDYNFRVLFYKILDSDLISQLSTTEISDYERYGQEPIISYHENHAMNDFLEERFDVDGNLIPPQNVLDICQADYLAIVVDNNDNYYAYIGKYATASHEPTNAVAWYLPSVRINTSQFKGLDMWLRFSGINEMIYFLLTKYTDDILSIDPATVDANQGNGDWSVSNKITTVDENSDSESLAAKGRLWAYVNPNTMQPYDDDYWFHQGEPFLVKSLTLASGKRIKANKIVVSANQWPGMYMLVGETYIRNKIGEDERMQIKIPFCKVKSNHTFEIQADGEPVVFSMELEAAKPPVGNLMEITTYEVATKMVKGENGCFYPVDGSTKVLSE